MEDEEVEAYKELLSDKVTELQQLQDIYSTHMEHCRTTQTELNESMQTATKQKAELARSAAEIHVLKAKLEEAEALRRELEELRGTCKELKESEEEKADEIEEITGEFKMLYETYVTEKAALQAQVEAAKSTATEALRVAGELEELTRSHSSLADENSKLIGRLAETEAALKTIGDEGRVNDRARADTEQQLKANLTKVTKERDSLAEAVQRLRKVDREATAKTEGLTRSLLEQQEELKRLQHKAESDFKEHQKTLHTAQLAREELHGQLTQLTEEYQGCEQHCQALVAEAAQLKQELTAAKARPDLTDQLYKSQREVAGLKAELSTGKVNELLGELSRERERHAELQGLLACNAEVVTSLKEENRALSLAYTAEIGRLTAQLETATQEVQLLIMESLQRPAVIDTSHDPSTDQTSGNGPDYRAVVAHASMLQAAIEFKDAQLSELQVQNASLQIDLRNIRLVQEAKSSQEHSWTAGSQSEECDMKEHSATDMVEELICLVNYSIREHRKTLQLQSIGV
jgi:chromosome segregation ATPase